MAWDFETEPEFQAKLDWADEFVREEVEPLDQVWAGLEFTPLDENRRKAIDPLKEEVRRQGLWATHLGPELGGAGLRPAQAVPAQRDPGPLVVGADRLRLPGARHRQRRDHRPLRHRRAEGAVPAAAARGRDLLLLLDDRAPRRRRPDDVHHPGREGRRRVGHQRLEVLLVERQHGRVPHRHGGHQPRRERLQGHVDVPGADRHAGRQHRPQRRPGRRAAGPRAPTPSSTTRTCGCPSRRPARR